MNVVRFPTEQCRLPNETPEAFRQRQAWEQSLNAQFLAAVRAWEPPLLDDLANGRESE